MRDLGMIKRASMLYWREHQHKKHAFAHKIVLVQLSWIAYE